MSEPKVTRTRKIVWRTYAWVLLLLAAFLAASSWYKYLHFRTTQFTEILFYARNGLYAAPSAGWSGSVPKMVLYTIVALVLLWLPISGVWAWLARRRRAKRGEVIVASASKWPRRLRVVYPSFVFILSLVIGLFVFQIPRYIQSLRNPTALYERYYVAPESVQIKAPAKKRNLIFIYLESIENTVASKASGGQVGKSLIPELEERALDPNNVSFTHKKGQLGGPHQVWGTSWSLAGMVASMGGIPLKASIGNTGNQLPSFLPGAKMLGDVLKENGYQQSLVMGTGPEFGGLDKLMSLHGDFNMLVPETLKASKRLDPNYHVWWGFEDRKMFGFAKQEATRLGASDKPFHLQLFVEDTHFPDGYLDPKCPQPYPRQYDNVHACASAQVNDFLNWVKQQPWGENTTIVMIGDHLGMQTAYYDELITTPNYVRTPYNVIINPAVRPAQPRARVYTSMDYYPTILAALGFQVPGERLGLGTNLFSKLPTLPEMMGINKFDMELSKRSDFYDDHLLQADA